MKRYQIIVNDERGGYLEKVVFGEEKAKEITNQLIEAGKPAYYEELPKGTAWFDDENWIG